MTQTLPLIDPERLPTRALTDAETYLKRQTFKVERANVLKLQRLYRAAYRDLALALSEAATRTEAEARIAERLARLRRDVLILLGAVFTTAWVGSYYGKLWLLDMATREDVRIINQHTGIYAGSDRWADIMFGDKPLWSLIEQTQVEMDALGVDVRRVLIAGVAVGLLQRLRRVLLKSNFNRVQVIARTGIQSAANTGALTAMQQNGALVTELQWLTGRDERVCNICRPRDGKRYPLNTLERPPIHPQCRCTLVPIVPDAIASSADTRLREPFARWVLTIGVARDVDDFLTP